MRKDKGFSSVEVVVALAVLIIGIVAAMRLFPIALRQIRVAQERAIVSELADGSLGHLRTAGGRNLLHNWDGMSVRFQGDPPTLLNLGTVYDAYQTTVHRMVSASEVYLHRVTLSVDMPDGRTERFVTYISEP